MCFLFVAFIILFGLINYKWGVVATPVLQYGMYSSPLYTKDTQTVYIIEADKKIINSAEISLTERDILQIFPDNYEREKLVNEAAYVTMKKYISYTGLVGDMSYDKYSNEVTDSIFSNWYKTKVEKITGNQVQSLSVYKQHFVWKQKKLEPIDTITKLTYIGAYRIP